MSVHSAQQLVDTAIADLVAAAKAEGYEMGFRSGEIKGTEKAMNTISMGDAAKGITPDFKAELHQMLDRIALFRHMIATHDTRYSMLGEIIADFAKMLGTAGPSESVIVNSIAAFRINIDDQIHPANEPNNWWPVQDVRGVGDDLVELRTASFVMRVGIHDMLPVRRPVQGA